MKEIIQIIMIILFYGAGLTFFIIMTIHENKTNKLHREYWKREIKRMEEMRKLECKKSAKKSKENE